MLRFEGHILILGGSSMKSRGWNACKRRIISGRAKEELLGHPFTGTPFAGCGPSNLRASHSLAGSGLLPFPVVPA